MLPYHLAQIELVDRISIDTHKRVIFKQPLGSLKLSCCCKRTFGSCVLNLDSKSIAVLKIVFYCSMKVADTNDNMVDIASVLQPLDNIFKERLIAKRKHWLWDKEGIRLEPRTQPTCQNYRFHTLCPFSGLPYITYIELYRLNNFSK